MPALIKKAQESAAKWGATTAFQGLHPREALFRAIRQKDKVLVERILSSFPVLEAADDSTGATPLMMATSTGSLEVIKVGSPVLIATDAASQGFQVLLAAGADVNRENNHGETAIHCIWDVWLNNSSTYLMFKHEYLPWVYDVARALLEAGANPNIGDKMGHTPLHRAAQYGYTKVLMLLLKVSFERSAVYRSWYSHRCIAVPRRPHHS